MGDRGRELGLDRGRDGLEAAELLVEEAGGKVTDLDGGPFELRSGRIVATNGRIHDELRQVISDYYAGRDPQ